MVEIKDPGRVIVDHRPWNKSLPNIDDDSRPFWSGLREHKFLIPQCTICHTWYWPIAFCRNHWNDPRLSNMAWAEASGHGVVFARSVVHYAFEPGFKDELPYALALVELEEGPFMSSSVIGMPASDVCVGLDVELVFEDHEQEDFTLPRFRAR